MSTTMDFSGQTVLVTGGTRGIGAAIAQRFLAAGAAVAVGGRTVPDRAPSAGDATAHVIPADIRDADSAATFVAEAVDHLGRLDVLVNNAGGSPDADAATVSPRFVTKIVELNLLAPFYTGQPANRVMQQQQDGGAIINIGSVSAHDPQPGTAAYSAAKAGLLGLTRALALEWAPKVRANHITTGLVHTDAAAHVYGADGNAAVAELVPMRRVALPDDVAQTCLYLASDLSGYVTGADIAVHGGGELPARYVATHGG